MKITSFISLLLLVFVSGQTFSQTSLDKKVKLKDSKIKIWYNHKDQLIESNREIRYEIYTMSGSIVKKGVGSSIICGHLMTGDYYLWVRTGKYQSLEPERKFDINNLPPNTYIFHVENNQ